MACVQVNLSVLVVVLRRVRRHSVSAVTSRRHGVNVIGSVNTASRISLMSSYLEFDVITKTDTTSELARLAAVSSSLLALYFIAKQSVSVSQALTL